ncbi:hypothetical protein NQ314_008010 [Rhamnusium bicolor]|uniref:Large ribosomal subunit protein mL42 n=1 Tax=Rhamnusium bicolor TaxID=1586634 RepID=A0AAV8YG54_9CUCU|nr:hypothetical protein NQ314_008010 [Rhamnusium bicolor]
MFEVGSKKYRQCSKIDLELISAMTLRIITTRLNISQLVTVQVTHRYRSTVNREHKIVVTKDGTTIVAWHPKSDFPYECTKPLPEENIEENSSVLKTQLTPEVMEIFNKKTPEQARQELMNITHTTKHRWFPRARDKKIKENTYG